MSPVQVDTTNLATYAPFIPAAGGVIQVNFDRAVVLALWVNDLAHFREDLAGGNQNDLRLIFNCIGMTDERFEDEFIAWIDERGNAVKTRVWVREYTGKKKDAAPGEMVSLMRREGIPIPADASRIVQASSMQAQDDRGRVVRSYDMYFLIAFDDDLNRLAVLNNGQILGMRARPAAKPEPSPASKPAAKPEPKPAAKPAQKEEPKPAPVKPADITPTPKPVEVQLPPRPAATPAPTPAPAPAPQKPDRIPYGKNPFYFRNGEVVDSITRLRVVCVQCRDDALYHLLNGHFEPWFRYIGREDLVSPTVAIRSSYDTEQQKLNRFLDLLVL